MKKNQIDIITMGCSKNLVDSELLMKQFEANGYDCVHDSETPEGEIAVINTCGFIETAKEESINTILEFVSRKENGQLRQLYVMGCLSQRYKEELEKEIPEVDKFYGKFNFKQLITDLGKAEIPSCDGRRHLTTPPHYAYIKIAEGCDRHCAYCAIPLITGKHRSRKMDDILQEVAELAADGVKEFQVIEQELTYYGVDLDGKHHITELISRMADIPGVEWIRLHYAYPNQFPWDLLDVIQRDRAKDRIMGYSLHGIHKDDLVMSLGGFPIKREGSQGQNKTFVLALKLAQFNFLKRAAGNKTPLLLLDDIFDKLDADRVEQIVKLVSGDSFGQIFITDTNRDHLDKILGNSSFDYKLFSVENGEVTERSAANV